MLETRPALSASLRAAADSLLPRASQVRLNGSNRPLRARWPLGSDQGGTQAIWSMARVCPYARPRPLHPLSRGRLSSRDGMNRLNVQMPTMITPGASSPWSGRRGGGRLDGVTGTGRPRRGANASRAWQRRPAPRPTRSRPSRRRRTKREAEVQPCGVTTCESSASCGVVAAAGSWSSRRVSRLQSAWSGPRQRDSRLRSWRPQLPV